MWPPSQDAPSHYDNARRGREQSLSQCTLPTSLSQTLFEILNPSFSFEWRIKNILNSSTSMINVPYPIIILKCCTVSGGFFLLPSETRQEEASDNEKIAILAPTVKLV